MGAKLLKMDLHVHTIFSDGELTPAQVVQKAVIAGLDAVAITDHDECRALEALSVPQTVCVIPGIEISAQCSEEVHILGLGIDIHNEDLQKHIEIAAKMRRIRILNIIEKLSSAGIAIKVEDVDAERKGRITGRPHVAKALIRKGYIKTVKEAFDKYLSSKTPYYVPRSRISVQKAVQLIKNARGLAVLAHPGLLKQKTFENLESKLKGLGFWGLEAYHPSHTDGQCVQFENYACSNSLFVTSGSDYHGTLTPVEIGCETRGGAFLQTSFNAIIKHIQHF